MSLSYPPEFRDRRHAGKSLASALQSFAGAADTIVLALPRGGVPVGYEVARALGLPLDVFTVRKLGVPGHEELAMGAIASGGVQVLNEEVIWRLADSEEVISQIAARVLAELERREILYRGQRPPLDVSGKTVIVVDDGLATGATMRAAVVALRQKGAARIVVAVPVGPIDTFERLRLDADEVICPLLPGDFCAVGQYYQDFSQTSDGEVRDLLEKAAAGASDENE
jgi:predicted phosphoribosyltransferase